MQAYKRICSLCTSTVWWPNSTRANLSETNSYLLHFNTEFAHGDTSIYFADSTQGRGLNDLSAAWVACLLLVFTFHYDQQGLTPFFRSLFCCWSRITVSSVCSSVALWLAPLDPSVSTDLSPKSFHWYESPNSRELPGRLRCGAQEAFFHPR